MLLFACYVMLCSCTRFHFLFLLCFYLILHFRFCYVFSVRAVLLYVAPVCFCYVALLLFRVVCPTFCYVMTPHPGPNTQDPKSRIQDLVSRIRDLSSRIQDLGSSV